MSAARFYSNYPGTDLAALAAQFILARVERDRLPEAVVLVPTRRAALSLREAFRQWAGEQTVLLPRMVSLADVGEELLTLLGHQALPVLQAIPPAMSSALRHYLLTAQVIQFEEARGGDSRIEHAMQMAEYLAELQDRCTRAGVALTKDRLHDLFPRDYATHWQQSLAFLNIVGEAWPAIEDAYGQISGAAHEVRVLQALTEAWASAPPSYPVFAVGSTASQPATAGLLSTIAGMEQGYVMLPGLDPRMEPQAWESVHESHPYFYLKQLLDANHVALRDVVPLGPCPSHCSIWLDALCRVEAMGQWRAQQAEPARFAPVRVAACQHAEEEARVIALLMREGLENPTARIALVTPDESLMARVAVLLGQFGLVPNRLSHGTLADTQTGAVLVALMEAVAAPESTRALMHLLRHPLVQLGDAASWPAWLDMFERASRGIKRHSVGQLPALAPVLRETAAYRQLQTLVRDMADLSRARLSASQWVERLSALLEKTAPLPGSGQEKVLDALEQCAGGDLLGKLDQRGFSALLEQALSPNWRGPQFGAHPQLVMLTPVEARLQSFDRVILGNMTERVWPGMYGQSPWLNRAQQDELGLPGVAEHSTLMAHDVLMHGSAGEVFLTYPQRDAGSPVARSRYLERLLALAEAQGLSVSTLDAAGYGAMALARFNAPFTPESEPYPRPSQRPAMLPASQLDLIVSDPFSIYARSILGLQPLQELDAEPEPRDFGSIAHKALQQLAGYWNEQGHAPDASVMQQMVEQALRDFSDRPAVRLFWTRRLMQALLFVNAQEAQRRGRVESEVPMEQAVATAHGAITLHGRIDRLEGAVVVDYKTGKPPSARDIEQGKALQLLAYALLLGEQGATVESLEYWGLPAGKREGRVEQFAWTPDKAADMTAKLHRLLDEFMDPTRALLARPISGTDAFDNDYDGISRYDEWAG